MAVVIVTVVVQYSPSFSSLQHAIQSGQVEALETLLFEYSTGLLTAEHAAPSPYGMQSWRSNS